MPSDDPEPAEPAEPVPDSPEPSSSALPMPLIAEPWDEIGYWTTTQPGDW